jgi:hypothetical protein
MQNVWVIQPLPRGGFRCYEVTTFGDGSFNVSAPVVLQNALLFLDGECIELGERVQQSDQSPDASGPCSFADTGDDELEAINNQLGNTGEAVRPSR